MEWNKHCCMSVLWCVVLKCVRVCQYSDFWCCATCPSLSVCVDNDDYKLYPCVSLHVWVSFRIKDQFQTFVDFIFDCSRCESRPSGVIILNMKYDLFAWILINFVCMVCFCRYHLFLSIFSTRKEHISCSVLTHELCLSFESYLWRLLAILNKFNVDDKSFPVSGLSCTHGSLLWLCQPVTW